MTTTTPDTFTSPAIDAGTGLREGYAEVGDVTLHYVEAGDGPLVLLLHGFPEFWYGWRQQIAPLVKAGFRVVAPDLRGYNLSSKPDGFADYTADKLADDIRGLIRELGAESAMVVGHDWGGTRRVDPGDESPGGRRPPRDPERGPSAQAERRTAQPASALAVLVLLLLPVPEAARAPCAPQALAVLQALPARRPPAVHGGGARSLRRGVVPARGGEGDDRLLPRRGAAGVEAGDSPRLGAHPGHLGAGRSLPRPQARRAAPRGRAQPRPRRAPARRVPLGPPRRG